jgi:hypothetical protein
MTPHLVASAVVVNSSRNTHSCETYHPAERRLSAIIPRDAAGTLHEMGPCGPSSRIPTAFGGMGPEGEPPNDTGHHYHNEHDGTGHFAGPTMLLGPHWSSSGIINNMNGGLSTSKTASGMTITSGVLDEYGKCIVPRSSHHDDGGSSSAYPRPAILTSEQAGQIQYDAMLGPSPEGSRVGQVQEHKPWNLSGHVSRMWNTWKGKGSTLKGLGQKGSGGRNAQNQGVLDQGPDVMNDLRFLEDLDVVEGTTFATPVPIQKPTCQRHP